MRKFILICAAIFSVVGACGQVKFEALAPITVTVGERFRIEFELTNAQGSNFAQPNINGADLLAGPSIANGMQTTFVNGKQSSVSMQTYTFIMYAPKAGTIKVGAATVLVNGKSYTTKPLTIDAVGGSGGDTQGGTAKGQANGAALAENDVLLRLEVSKTNVYKGEAIVASLKLYNRVAIANVENVKYAAFNGFWTQELDAGNGQPSRATIGGKSYTGQVVRQWLVFPQKSGVLEIEQNEFTIVAQVVTQAESGSSLMDEFFGGMGNVEYVKRKIVATPVKINVKELPKPQPENFSGAVGKFTLESSISANSLPANSSGNVTLKLSGTGNFPLITTPDISLPAAFEKYDVKINDQVKYSSAGANGTKIFEFPFITRAEGDYNISPIEISYFDVATGNYKTLSSGSFKMQITKGSAAAQTAGAFISGVTKEDLKMLGQDVRFIKVGDPKLKSRTDQFLWSIGFFVAFLLIIILFISMMFVTRKMIEQRADIVKIKNKKANKVAIKRLKRSHAFMVVNNKDRFYEEMLRALWGYIGDKLAIEVADLTKARVADTLMQRGVSQGQANEFLNLIGRCELAQYSQADDDNMTSLYNNAIDIIGNMEVK